MAEENGEVIPSIGVEDPSHPEHPARQELEVDDRPAGEYPEDVETADARPRKASKSRKSRGSDVETR